MEHTNWNNQTLTVAEWIPICILGLEALLGVACNLVAAATYCRQTQRLFNNPGNTFTVRLHEMRHVGNVFGEDSA